MKTCSTCGKEKALEDFTKSKKGTNGRSTWCKPCANSWKRRWERTPKGRTSMIYTYQLSSSKDRGHPLPSYTREWLTDWLMSKPLFHELMSKWKDSGYKKSEVPSIDRIDSRKPYTKDNIQLMTWKENEQKGHLERMNGKTKYPLKSVCRLDSTGKILDKFISIAEAARQTGINRNTIACVCRGKELKHRNGNYIPRTIRGYKWKYTKDLN